MSRLPAPQSMPTKETTTVRLWLPPEELAEIEHERQREEYEREAIETAKSEEAWNALQQR